jgi:cell division protease FtsH
VMVGLETPHTLSDRERRVVAFHEAGHALLAELLPGTTKTQRVSIVPRGGALGYVFHLPEEDRHLDTRVELMNQLVVLLGGRAAEELVFGSITNGASDDLRKVALITRQMIHEWAMGTSVSAIQLLAEGGAVSDRTRELRDAEQQHFADEAMRRAVALISEYRPQLDAIATALLHHEVLEGSDIARIMEGVQVAGGEGARLQIAATTPTNVHKPS